MRYKCLVECTFVVEVEVEDEGRGVEWVEGVAALRAAKERPGADDYSRVLVEDRE